MKKEKTTLKYLENEVWWWLPGAKNYPTDRRYHGALAFNYELVRRVYRKECFVAFPRLKYPHIEIIGGLCDAAPFEMPSRPAEPQLQTEAGWTHEIHLQWNLKLPDLTLQKAFLDLIHREREFQGIPKPRQNVGNRNRGLSWRWLELMDISHFKIRLLSDAERSSLSDARTRAKQKARIFTA